jgi:hypothetical protein
MTGGTEITPTPETGQSPEKVEKLRRIGGGLGTVHTSTIEHLWGAGKELWSDDAEFEAFLTSIHTIRVQKD